MAYGLDDDGFKRKPLHVSKSELETGLQGEFGSELQIDPSSPEGQFIGLFSGSLDDLWQIAEAASQIASVDDSSNEQLTFLASLNNVFRAKGDFATTDVTFVATNQDRTLSSGLLTLRSENGTLYAPIDPVNLITTSGSTVKVRALVAGEVGATNFMFSNQSFTSSGMENVISSVTNTNTVDGNSGESDSELRTRRQFSLTREGPSQPEAIREAVLDLDGVDDCYVVISPNGTGDDGQPQYSVRTIVELSSSNPPSFQQVGEAIFSQLSAGIPTWAWTSAGTDKTITVQDSQGTSHTVYWETPREVPIYIKVTGTVLAGDDTYTRENLKNALVEFCQSTYGLGDDVFSSQMYPIANAQGKLNITDIELGTFGYNTNNKISLAVSRKPIFSTEFIDLTALN